MSDIAERLRKCSTLDVWLEAADEIDRLRGLLRGSRYDMEAAYNGLDFLTNLRVAEAADPNGARQLAVDAADVKGRLLRWMRLFDAALGAAAQPPAVQPEGYGLRAAIRWKSLVFSLPRPARHHHIIRKVYELTGEEVGAENGYEQGFTRDDGGGWLTREEVFAMTGKGRGGKSFSEDLWESTADNSSTG